MRISSGKKGISPVLATVILIAITLIAAIGIAGFVFGLFGSFTSTARVSVSSVGLSAVDGSYTVTLTNSGSSSVNVVSMRVGGSPCTVPSPAVTVVAGQSTSFSGTCSLSGATTGTQFSGSVGLSNGGQAFFYGQFGSSAGSALVSAAFVSCASASNPATCVVNLSNTGTSAVMVSTPCHVTISGSSDAGAVTPIPPVTIPAGGTPVQVSCMIGATFGDSPGTPATGYFTLSSGASVQFSGTWS